MFHRLVIRFVYNANKIPMTFQVKRQFLQFPGITSGFVLLDYWCFLFLLLPYVVFYSNNYKRTRGNTFFHHDIFGIEFFCTFAAK